MKKEYKRGEKFNEIIFSTVNNPMQKKILKLIEGAKNAQKVDEHGNWDFHNNVNYEGVGEALNWDLYDYGLEKFLCELPDNVIAKKWASNVNREAFRFELPFSNKQIGYSNSNFNKQSIQTQLELLDKIVKDLVGYEIEVGF